jgi:hypothetical protein
MTAPNIPLETQIAFLRLEIKARARASGRLIASGIMTRQVYDEEFAALQAILATLGSVRDRITAAYIAGATAAHSNHQHDRAPEFSEAARDYMRAELL